MVTPFCLRPHLSELRAERDRLRAASGPPGPYPGNRTPDEIRALVDLHYVNGQIESIEAEFATLELGA